MALIPRRRQTSFELVGFSGAAMKQERERLTLIDVGAEDGDPGQTRIVHSVAVITAAAELGLLPATTFGYRAARVRKLRGDPAQGGLVAKTTDGRTK